MYKYILCLILVSLFCNFAEAQTIENVKITDLEEFVVKAKNAYIDGEKYIFTPTKSDKNLSNNPASLIENLNCGLLYTENGVIKSRIPGEVSIFINGVLADEMDLSTFWPKNVSRIEYMYSSTDPKFQGRTNIINFIMRDYSFGGLSKVDLEQKIPNDGDYSLSSKFLFKEMTYNLLLKGHYSRNNQEGSNNEETFDGAWYEDSYYDEISRIACADVNSKKNEQIYVGLNARYQSNKTSITHSIKLQWDNNPGSFSKGAISYKPEIITSDEMSMLIKSRSLSPTVNGTYSIVLNSKLNLTAFWSLIHSHNNNFSSYEEVGVTPIETGTKENSFSLYGSVSATYRYNPKSYISLAINGLEKWFDTDYSGDTKSNQHLRNDYGRVLGSWGYTPNRIFSFSAYLQMIYQGWNVNHEISYDELSWGAQGFISASINNRNRINFSFGISPAIPEAATRNELILRQTELKWLQGNPGIKTPVDTYMNLNYTWMPNSLFRLFFGMDYRSKSSAVMIEYSSGGTQYDGLIGKFTNAGRENILFTQFTPSIYLFGGNLRINLETDYNLFKYANTGHRLSVPRFRPAPSWRFGNNRISAYYMTPMKNFANGGTQVIKGDNSYGISYTYGNGNLYLNITLDKPFNKHTISKVTENNGPYNLHSLKWDTGRNLSIYISYTFDYGKKKVSGGIDIEAENLRSSSVLDSSK